MQFAGSRLALTGLGILAVTCLDSVAYAQDWMPQNGGTANQLSDLWFTDAATGWAVGDNGTIISTADSGNSWNPTSLTAFDLDGIAFLDGNTGLIVGDNGLILRTLDGGTSWSPVGSGTGENLNGVAFGSGGFAVTGGREGVIVRSGDTGASWTVAESGGGTRYRDVAAVGSSAWYVGDGGAIRATTDSGLTWFGQNGGTGSDLKSVFFLDELEGWIAGSNDVLLYTANGGATWASRNAGIVDGTDAVFFVDSNEGWAAGNAGAIYHTTNGGVSWIAETTSTTNELNDLFFADAMHGWCVGDVGTINARIPDVVGAEETLAEMTGIEMSNAPNPFGPTTRIGFSLPAESSVSLVVFDTSGREVRSLMSRESVGSGTHSVEWDGRDDFGHLIASGVYFYQLRTDSDVVRRKMTLRR